MYAGRQFAHPITLRLLWCLVIRYCYNWAGVFGLDSSDGFLLYVQTRNRRNNRVKIQIGSRPYSWAIWDFWFNGSMVQSICDCGVVQSAVCLSECLAAAPIFLLGATRHFFLLFPCKICAEIVVHRMFAVSLNGLNGKSSSRSIVQKIFSRFICFILGFKISYSEYSFVTQNFIPGIRIV